MKNPGKWNRWVRNTLLIVGLGLCAFFLVIIPVGENYFRNKHKNTDLKESVYNELSVSNISNILADPCTASMSKHPSYQCKQKRKRDTARRKEMDEIRVEIEAGPPDIAAVRNRVLRECFDGIEYTRSSLRECYKQIYTQELALEITSYCLEKYRVNDGISMSECRAEQEEKWRE